jgi:hypothetical protein
MWLCILYEGACEHGEAYGEHPLSMSLSIAQPWRNDKPLRCSHSVVERLCIKARAVPMLK